MLLNFPLDRFFQYAARLFLLIWRVVKYALPDTVNNFGVVHFSVWLMVIIPVTGRGERIVPDIIWNAGKPRSAHSLAASDLLPVKAIPSLPQTGISLFAESENCGGIVPGIYPVDRWKN